MCPSGGLACPPQRPFFCFQSVGPAAQRLEESLRKCRHLRSDTVCLLKYSHTSWLQAPACTQGGAAFGPTDFWALKCYQDSRGYFHESQGKSLTACSLTCVRFVESHVTMWFELKEVLWFCQRQKQACMFNSCRLCLDFDCGASEFASLAARLSHHRQNKGEGIHGARCTVKQYKNII